MIVMILLTLTILSRFFWIQWIGNKMVFF